MKKTQLTLSLLGAVLSLAAISPASAALVIHYSFNGNSLGALTGGETIDNVAGATEGTFTAGTVAGGSASIVSYSGGKALKLTPGADNAEVGGAPHVATGFTASAAGITGSTAYTAMAWVNFLNATGDNMIFGSSDGATPALHNGSRNGTIHSGHWGDDLGPDQIPAGPDRDKLNSMPGSWHHVAYTNDANNAQSMYFDAVLVAGPAAGGPTAIGGMNILAPLVIGTSRNGGSFNGLLDEVRVYNTTLTLAEIRAASGIPEPGTTSLVALIGLSGLMMRRRR